MWKWTARLVCRLRGHRQAPIERLELGVKVVETGLRMIERCDRCGVAMECLLVTDPIEPSLHITESFGDDAST